MTFLLKENIQNKIIFFVVGVLLSLMSIIFSLKLILGCIFLLGFVIFSFFYIELSFSIFLFMVFIIPHQYWHNTFLLLSTVFYFSIYFLQVFANKRNCIKLSSLQPALIVFVFTALISMFFTYDFKDSLRILLLLLSGILTSIFIQAIVENKKTLNIIIVFLILSMFIACIYGLLQYKMGIAVRLDFVDVTKSAGLSRLYSTMDNPNNFAEFLIIILPLSVAYILNCKDDTKRLMFTLIILPCFLALILTSSRSAYLAIGGCVATFVFIGNKKLIPLFILLFIMSIPFIPQSIIDRLLTIGKDSSSQYRILIWIGSLKTLADHWLHGIGIGPGAFSSVFPSYVAANVATVRHAHNLFLQIWIEMGIFGVVAFIVLIFNTLKSCIVNSINTEFKYYYAGLASSLVGILMIGMVEYVWFYPRDMFSFWILMGLIFATNKISTGDEK